MPSTSGRRSSSLEREAGRMQVDGGYLQDEGLLERYKRLSIPVRRALNGSDRASFAQALARLEPGGPAGDLRGRAEAPGRSCSRSSTVTVVLGGEQVARRQILIGWLDAAAFYDQLDRDRAYDQLIDRLGQSGRKHRRAVDGGRRAGDPAARRSRRRRARRTRHPAAAGEDAAAAARSERILVEATIRRRTRDDDS